MKTYGRKSRGRQKYDTSLNFDLICRLCLTEDGEMKELFQEDEPDSVAIPDKILNSVCVAVCENDGLPNQICKECLNQVEKFQIFKLKCEESDAQLRKVLKSKKSQQSGEAAEDEEEEKPADADNSLTVTSISSSKLVTTNKPTSSNLELIVPEPTESMNTLLDECEKQRGEAQLFVSSDTGNFVIDVSGMDDKTSDSVDTVSFDIDLPADRSSQPYEIEVEEEEMEEQYLEVEEELEGRVDGDRIVLIRRSVKHETSEEEQDYENEESIQEPQGDQLFFPFKCDSCPKSFNKRIDLRRHQSVHLQRRGFDCATCEKWFPNQTTLKRHERSHTGERPFECSECGKRFSQAGIMQRHMHTHTGFKPYTCHYCPKGFTQREGLKVHLRTHTPKNPEEIQLHECPLCDKSFCHPSGLSRHLIKHTGKTFCCTYCPRKFTDPSSLKRHSKIHGEVITVSTIEAT